METTQSEGEGKRYFNNFRYSSHENALVVTCSLTKFMFIKEDSGEIPNAKTNPILRITTLFQMILCELTIKFYYVMYLVVQSV